MNLPLLSSHLLVRPLQSDDVDQLLHIQTVCYGPDFLESREVFAQRLACAHHCSLAVVDRHDSAGPLQAYLAAYWSNPGKITPLNAAFAAPEPGEQVLYLHDMSVLPQLAGQGVARYLVQRLFQQARARGLQQAALVSVQDSQAYWVRQGFSAESVNDVQQLNHLKSYGEGACYMTIKL